MIAHFAQRTLRNESDDVKKSANQKGVLISSGLIAGEAITGIALAIPIVAGISLPIKIFENGPVSVLLFLAIGFALYRVVIAGRNR